MEIDGGRMFTRWMVRFCLSSTERHLSHTCRHLLCERRRRRRRRDPFHPNPIALLPSRTFFPVMGSCNRQLPGRRIAVASALGPLTRWHQVTPPFVTGAQRPTYLVYHNDPCE